MLKNIIIVNDSNFICGGEDKVAIQTVNEISVKYPELNLIFFSCNGVGKSPSINKNVVQYCTEQGNALNTKNKIKGAINGICNFKFRKEFKKILKKYDCKDTIVHVHSWSKAVTSEVFDICYKNNIKCVLTLHDYFIGCPNGGFFNYKKENICKKNPMSMKCILCDCDSRNYLFKVYRILRQLRYKKNVKKIKYAISISSFSEKILKKYLNKNCMIERIYNPIDFDKKSIKVHPETSDYYLYVGRISKEKGVDVFCKAITACAVKGIVVGEGNYREELEKSFPNINFVGWKNSTEVKEVMKKSRCLIIPSKWYECAPLTPLEAMQYGIPCISSSNNAAVDYVGNDNGMTYTNMEGLIKLIKKCGDDAVIKKYSDKSFKYIENKWKNKNYVDDLINFYNNILDDKYEE